MARNGAAVPAQRSPAKAAGRDRPEPQRATWPAWWHPVPAAPWGEAGLPALRAVSHSRPALGSGECPEGGSSMLCLLQPPGEELCKYLHRACRGGSRV